MNTKNEKLKREMEEKGIHPTSIRFRVLDLLRRKRAHLSAEEIYKKISQSEPVLSKTSVYNAVNLFAERGLIGRVEIGGVEVKFDGEISPHHHFYCVKCGEITDIDVSCPFFKKGFVDGNKITEFHGYFKGICKKCLKKERHNNG